MKEYTEEDLRDAFYKGREMKKLPDGKEIYIRPTFNGYLRELDGKENPTVNFNKRVEEYHTEIGEKHDALIQKLTNILIELKDVAPEKIKLESKLKNDLRLDSLDIVEVVMECETKFSIRIDDDLFGPMQRWTVGDMVEFLEEIIKEQE